MSAYGTEIVGVMLLVTTGALVVEVLAQGRAIRRLARDAQSAREAAEAQGVLIEAQSRVIADGAHGVRSLSDAVTTHSEAIAGNARNVLSLGNTVGAHITLEIERLKGGAL